VLEVILYRVSCTCHIDRWSHQC